VVAVGRKEKKKSYNKTVKNSTVKNSIIFFLIILFIIIADQLLKFIVRTRTQLGESRVLIDGFLNITKTHNTGAGFGILKGQGWLFIIVAAIVLCALVYYNKQIRSERLLSLACGLIAGGTIGNLIDRIFFSYVIDYIDFSFWPTFNLADASLTIGTLGMIVWVYWNERIK
jgi:signal peptidase II